MSLLTKASMVMTPNAVKESKVYSIIPSNGNGDLDFTRGTEATSTLNNDSGLIESVPYNLLKYSEQFDNVAFWQNQIGGTGVNPIRTANTVVSPNGTLTADTIIFNRGVGNTSTDQSVLFQVVAISPLTDYTFSLWVKASAVGDVGKQIFIRCGANGAQVAFTLTINWVKIQVSTNISAIGTCYMGSRGGSTADNVVSVDLWGGQLNQGLSAKDYFFTTDRLNVPRLNYDSVGGCPSLLLEPQRTNSNRNSTMQGANVSTNTFPNFWSVAGNGLTAQLVGLGVENGLNYIDVNYNGVAVATSIQVQFDTNTTINAIVGQAWSLSVYMKTISATLPPNSYRIQINEFSSAGSYLTGGQLVISPTTAIQRFSQTRTNTSATCAFVNSYYFFTLTVGNSYNFTIRIYAPQLEQGAYPTSYIPTTTSSVTRNADIFSRNNIYTNGLITSAGGTWFVELNNNVSLIRDATSAGLTIDSSAGYFLNGFLIRNNFSGVATRLAIEIRTGGSVVSGGSYTTLTETVKIAIKWDGVNANVYVNGAIRLTNVPFTTKIMENLAGFAQDAPRYIKSMLLFPTPLTDTEMINLTTL